MEEPGRDTSNGTDALPLVENPAGDSTRPPPEQSLADWASLREGLDSREERTEKAKARAASSGEPKWYPRCPNCMKVLPKISRDYLLPGSGGEVLTLDAYPAGSLFEPEMPVLGHLNSKQAASVWGVPEKTLSAAMPELRNLGIVSWSSRKVRVDTALFVLGWIHGSPERKKRADLLRERAERKLKGERLPLGRPPKKAEPKEKGSEAEQKKQETEEKE